LTGGVIKTQKQRKVLEFKSLEENMKSPNFESCFSTDLWAEAKLEIKHNVFQYLSKNSENIPLHHPINQDLYQKVR
jgi:hypothetical protein